MVGRPGGIFTRDERAVVAFIAVSLAVGSLLLAARRVSPGLGPPGSAAGDQRAADTGAPQAPPATLFPLDLNAATEIELLELPGIGPVKAAAIVQLRGSKGGLTSVDDLLEVRGIGPRTLEKLRPLVVVRASAVPVRDTTAGVGGTPSSGGSQAAGAQEGGRDP